MALENVSSYILHQTTLRDINNTTSELARQQMQLSSGNAAQDFSDMPGQTQQYLSLESSMSRAEQYLRDNKIIATRIDATATALSQVIDSVTTLKSMISQRRTGGANNAAFQTQIQGIWKGLTGQLNSSVSGQYIFSGTRLDSPAVNSTVFPSVSDSGEPDASYYTGSNGDLIARPQDNTVIQYNVRADNSAFQKIMAALAIARDADTQQNDADLQNAYNLAAEGLNEVVNLQSTVNANKVTVASINQSHESLSLYWRGLKESIGNTDVIAVSTQVAINQGILQASFQAFAKINALRLSDYLR